MMLTKMVKWDELNEKVKLYTSLAVAVDAGGKLSTFIFDGSLF